MKSSLMRPALVLALALGLASCGGKAEFTVGGTVTGQLYKGLVLTTNGMDVTVAPPPPPATPDTPPPPVPYSFPKQLQYGDVYDVTVKLQPDHQTCVPTTSVSDTAGRLSSINVSFACSLTPHALRGTVSGLTADGLVLANGSTGGTVTLAKGTSAFSLPAVVYGVTYGVTVQTQPAGLTCTVTNGTGVMADADVDTILVTCT